MKLKRFFFVLLTLGGCGLMANAIGQQYPYPPQLGPTSFTLNGSSGTFVLKGLNGQGFCTAAVPSTATMGSGTITIKLSNDNGSTYYSVSGVADLGNPASPAPSQTITVAGTKLAFPVSGSTDVELVLSGATNAVITGTLTCNAGNAVVITSGGGSTSAPQNTASPTASGGVLISGSFPYTIFASPLPPFPLSTANGGTGTSAPSPTVTATACAASPSLSGTWPSQTISVPAGCTVSTASPNPYVSTVLAETSATHFWEMNDSPGVGTPSPGQCPSTIADAIAGGATGAPSPVPLTVEASPLPHPAGSPYALQCGVTGIIKNGTTGIEWLGATIQAYLQVPSAVFQTLCNTGGGTCNLPFTVECIVEPANSAGYGSSGTNFMWSIDTAGTHGYVEITNPGSGDMAVWKTTGASFIGVAASGVPVMIDYEFDGTSESYYFINGTLALYAATSPQMTASSLSFFGWDGTTSANNFWNGRMHGCSTYNTALSIAKIHAHYAATGLP
jgi:hypothetical protein